ncbi:MAG: chalcone isomerase family protein [Acidobacteriota bacterium]
MGYQKIIAVAAATAFAFLLPTTPTHAAKLGGVTMAESQQVGGEELVLNGLGLRKRAVFKVYVGGLYLKQKQTNPQAILSADEPRRLVMQFVRKVDAEAIAGGWDSCLANNAPNAGADVKKGFAQLNGWMTDVEKGDQLIFTYEPGKGVSVDVVGQNSGTVAGKPFADALFSCWIGDTPPSADFKKGLLGG